MSIRMINDEVQLQNELSAAGENLIIAGFMATWCGPCQRIAPQYEILANKYAKAIFLKIDIDKCQDTAESQGVTAMPTFLFFHKGKNIDCVEGANVELLTQKLEQHVEGKIFQGSDDDIEAARDKATTNDFGQGFIDLNSLISKQGCECLNDCDEHPMAHCLIKDEEFYLQSDCDEQLILAIAFNQRVKIKALLIRAPIDQGPKNVKIFINTTHTFDFESVEKMPSLHELFLEPKDFAEGSTIELPYVKFQNVQNVQMFVRNNQSGCESTRIDYIGFIGAPIKTTNMTDFKRVAGNTGEAH